MIGWLHRDRDQSVTNFGAGRVVSQADAGYSQIVVVAGGTGLPLRECNNLDWYALDQLEEALERHGYKVTKPRKRPLARRTHSSPVAST